MSVGTLAVEAGALAPSINIVGSYFPSWMLCALAAVVVVAIVRTIFVRVGFDRSLPAPFFVYLALTVATSLGFWFVWLG
jgi:hypothetical protein